MTAPTDRATAAALWVVGEGSAEVREAFIDAPGPGEVRVRALTSGISRGTERLVFEGRVPPSQHARMRAPFQEGELPSPVKYGYASVGVIEAVGPGATRSVGERVFCLYPHQSRYTVPADRVLPVPEGVPAERAVLAANLETAINACWDAAPRVGDRAIVVGAGVVGLLVAYLLRRVAGVELYVLDPEPTRRPAAEALGFTIADTAPGDADLVVHTSGTEAGLREALARAGMEATVLELSWYGDRAPAVPLGEAFHSRRLKLISSQVGAIPPARVARWTHARRLGLALSLLTDPAFDALVRQAVPLEGLPAALPALLSSPSTLCARVKY